MAHPLKYYRDTCIDPKTGREKGQYLPIRELASKTP